MVGKLYEISARGRIERSLVEIQAWAAKHLRTVVRGMSSIKGLNHTTTLIFEHRFITPNVGDNPLANSKRSAAVGPSGSSRCWAAQIPRRAPRRRSQKAHFGHRSFGVQSLAMVIQGCDVS